MADKKFMGSFDNETEVLRKIEELRERGASELDMYVLARNENQVSMIRGQTDVDYTAADGNWRDKFQEVLSGSESVRNELANMGLDKEETDSYYEEVEDGRLLLFVDGEISTGAGERGFNSMAAFGDPKEDLSETPMEHGMSVEIDGENSPFSTDSEGNVTTGDGEGEVGSGISANQRTDDLAVPNDNLSDIAGTGRNRRDVPMTDQQIDDVPANDPNAEDAGPVKNDTNTGDVRTTDSVVDDLSGIDVSEKGLPANDQAPSDVPQDPDINDVPNADRSLDRLSDTESPEHWTQNAADRTNRNDKDSNK